jgi:hypothetical protein
MVAVFRYGRLLKGGFQVSRHDMLSRVVGLWDIGAGLFTGARLCLLYIFEGSLDEEGRVEES